MGQIRPFLGCLGLGMLLSIAIGCHRPPIIIAEDSIIPPAGGMYPVPVRPVFSPRLGPGRFEAQMPEVNPTNDSILLKIPPLPETLPKTHVISS